MSTIPSEIAAIIEQRIEEVKREEETRRIEDEAAAAKQREENHAAWIGLYAAVNEALPEVAAYLRTNEDDGEPNEYQQMIVFEVPGLAPIKTVFEFEKDAGWGQKKSNRDKLYEVMRYEECYPNEYTEHKMIEARWWWSTNSLADALCLAEKSEREHQALIAVQEQRRSEAEQASTEREQREAQVEIETSKRDTADQVERERLFMDLNQDPVAIALMKVFSAVRAERDDYISQINGLNDNLSSMDEHYSRRIAEVKSAADEVRREAEAARIEVTDKSYEVDQLEEKLKKAKRGW